MFITLLWWKHVESFILNIQYIIIIYGDVLCTKPQKEMINHDAELAETDCRAVFTTGWREQEQGRARRRLATYRWVTSLHFYGHLFLLSSEGFSRSQCYWSPSWKWASVCCMCKATQWCHDHKITIKSIQYLANFLTYGGKQNINNYQAFYIARGYIT